MFVAFYQDSGFIVQKQIGPVFADFLSHSHLLAFHFSAVSAFVLDLVFMKFLNVAFPPIVPELNLVVVVLDFLAHRIS